MMNFRRFIDPNIFHINNEEELHLQHVACAFSVHKAYVIDVAEDEQCKIRQSLSAVHATKYRHLKKRFSHVGTGAIINCTYKRKILFFLSLALSKDWIS